MKQLHLITFYVFPLFAIPLILISGNQVISLFNEFGDNGIFFFAFIVILALFLFHLAIFLTFSYMLYRWVKAIIACKGSTRTDCLYSNHSDLISKMMILEIVMLVIGLIVYVPGVREVLGRLGALL